MIVRKFHRLLCTYFLGHRWKEEKDFLICARCHTVLSCYEFDKGE